MTTALLEREQTKTPVVVKGYDNRYFPRWEVNKRVEYSEEGRLTIQSHTKDLSLDGASISVFGNPPGHRLVKLRIHLADKDIFEARGRVVWCEKEPTHKLFGIVFEKIGKEAQELIVRHAFEVRDDRLSFNG